MAKFAMNLLYLSRSACRSFVIQNPIFCKLCQKSISFTGSCSCKLYELRHLSTISRLCQQRSTDFKAFGVTDMKHTQDESTKRMTDQENALIPVINEGNSLTSVEWEQLKCEIFELRGYINSFNFDAVAMGFCAASKQFDVGLSLYDHIMKSGKEANIATLSRFLKLCSVCHCAPISDNLQTLILSVYSKLRNLSSLMNESMAENAIHALVLTENWKEGVELLSMIKLTGVPSNSAYNVLAKAAFDNNDSDTGWDLMNEMVHQNRRPSPDTDCAVLNFSSRCPNAVVGQGAVQKLLSFYCENDLIPTKNVAVELQSWFLKENPNWKSNATTLNKNGACKSCKKSLESITISEEEFQALQSNFINKVVVGSNIFLKTSPVELENFRKFLERSIPYDVVIDGLNVAFSAKSSKNAPHGAFLLQSVVKHFLDESKKVVVFGRSHMKTWPKQPMNFVFRNSKTFLANNISQDDPFLLYATMYGGLGTCFVSRDLMRSHMYLLKDQTLKAVFKKWQQQHQFSVVYIQDDGNVILKPPLFFNPSVQRRPDGGWHIPFNEEYMVLPPQTLDPPSNWLCLGPEITRKTKAKGA